MLVANMFFTALFFGTLGFVGTALAGKICARLPRLENAPPAGKAPVPWIVGGAALLGALVALHGAPPQQVFLLGIVTLALAGVWCADTEYGIVPDVFTLGPLAAILLVAILMHQWWIVLSAFVPFVPFALAAVLSKGHGMGWGDVKLVALGGALLGMQLSIVAFMAACVAAVVVARFARVRSGPIAFAPYLVAAIGVSLGVVGN
ncbi:MAG TPA: prepilin peptidase [Candidatus Baltobacteraceae bacterium]|jgi:prepilin signal peptidase PulO-like enzyme (type II secretory pathway)